MKAFFKNSLLVILVSGLYFMPLYGQKVAYPFAEIPDSLLKEANAVIRHSETRFTVFSEGNAKEETHFVITILNAKGAHHGELNLHKDKFFKPKFLEGGIYDHLGQRITKLSTSVISERNPYSSMSLYDDNKVLNYTPKQRDYPYTIEYKYETEYKGLMWYPAWYPQPSHRISVQNSEFVVELPLGQKLRYKALNLENELKHSSGKPEVYRWSVGPLKSYPEEAFSPTFSELAPQVLTAPGDFEFGGTRGSMESWQDIGKWNFDLNAQVDDLSIEVRDQVTRLTAGMQSTDEKVAAVYGFLQSRTRYVSIQFGIGGWRSFPASTTHEKGFGDCKALTWYTRSLLEAIGIPSFPALVKAGRLKPSFHTDFPSNQFNHVILCVPTEGDSLWLECTSQENPCGFLGSFTDDRPVLLLSQNGGKLTRTPGLSAAENHQNRKAELVLQTDGSASFEVSTNYGGIQFESALKTFLLNEEDRKKKLYQSLDLPQFTLLENEWKMSVEGKPSLLSHLKIKMKRFGARTGKRLFFSPNLLNRMSPPPKVKGERKSEVFSPNNWLDIDTIVIVIPSGAEVEYLPEGLNTSCSFGAYQASYQVEDGKLIYIRRMEMWKVKKNAEKFSELIAFLAMVHRQDAEQVVLKARE